MMYGKEGKIYEALDVLEDRMMRKDRIMPDTRSFEKLIRFCADAGYMSKAFDLARKVRRKEMIKY